MQCHGLAGRFTEIAEITPTKPKTQKKSKDACSQTRTTLPANSVEVMHNDKK
jgi:hypothetical protein